MRGLVQNLYAVVFRGQALIGLCLVLWFMSSVPQALSTDYYVGVPLAGAVIVGVVSIALLWSYLTPDWLGYPAGFKHLLPVVLSHTILPFLYIFVAMSAVVASGIAEPMARQLSVGISLVLIAASLIAWGLGTALCCWQDRQTDPEPVDIADYAPETAVVADKANTDFKALRQSRMRAS